MTESSWPPRFALIDDDRRFRLNCWLSVAKKRRAPSGARRQLLAVHFSQAGDGRLVVRLAADLADQFAVQYAVLLIQHDHRACGDACQRAAGQGHAVVAKNSAPRMVDRLTTFSSPSAPQKRFCANGRSAEMQSTTVFARALAWALNLRTEVAQVGVSTLGKMLRILRLPAKAASSTSARSAPTRRNGGLLAGLRKLAGYLDGGAFQGDFCHCFAPRWVTRKAAGPSAPRPERRPECSLGPAIGEPPSRVITDRYRTSAAREILLGQLHHDRAQQQQRDQVGDRHQAVERIGQQPGEVQLSDRTEGHRQRRSRGTARWPWYPPGIPSTFRRSSSSQGWW